MMKKIFPCSPDILPELLCPELKPVFLAHQNPWFKVMSRGSYYTLEYERPQVVILPILEGSSIIMVRVKRPLINDCPLELPAGDSIEGESPRMAAIREFTEETGINIKDPLRFIPELPVSEMPGRMPNLLSIFRVEVHMSELDSKSKHDDEISSVEVLSFSDIEKKIMTGKIYLSSPIAIISRFLFRRNCENTIMEEK